MWWGQSEQGKGWSTHSLQVERGIVDWEPNVGILGQPFAKGEPEGNQEAGMGLPGSACSLVQWTLQ
jgi:hypothetical protein